MLSWLSAWLRDERHSYLLLNAQQAAQPLPAQGAASGRIGIGDAALILVIPQHSDLMEELASSSEGDDQEEGATRGKNSRDESWKHTNDQRLYRIK